MTLPSLTDERDEVMAMPSARAVAASQSSRYASRPFGLPSLSQGAGVTVLTGAEPEEIWPLVRDHHYSGRMPANIQHCYAMRAPGGLWGDTGAIVAAVIFSIPPTRWTEDVIELSRLVRLPDCRQPLSELISFGCQWLRRKGWHLAVSFADWTHNHHGGVYQASGWRYAGFRDRQMDGLIIDGVFKPGRSCNSAFGTRSPTKLREALKDAEIEPHYDEGKHLYWRALTVAGRTRAKRLELASLPYPKPRGPSIGRTAPSGVSQEHTLGAAPLIAQAGEARRAETALAGSVHEHAVATNGSEAP